MLAAVAVTFTACEPAGQGGSGEGEGGEIPVVEFYGNEEAGTGVCQQSMSFAEMGMPGQYLMLMNDKSDNALLFMLDYDCGETYQYLTSHHYPLVEGSFNMGVVPEVSCLMVDPGYTNFTIGGVIYYPIVPETANDADGNPYGVTVMTMCDQGVDMNLLEFNVPAVTELDNTTGKPVEGCDVYVIKGSYQGSLQYVLAKASMPFDLEQWGHTNFVKTEQDGVITLTSDSTTGGKFVMNFNTWGTEPFATEEGQLYFTGDALTGYYVDFVEGETYYTFSDGARVTLATTATEGQYVLTISSRAGKWLLQNPDAPVDYEVVAKEYTLTVTDAPATEE